MKKVEKRKSYDDGLWRHKALFLNKYKPETIKDDWTSISDVGKIHNSKVVTYADYFLVENKFIENIICFFKLHKVEKVYLSNIEKKGIIRYYLQDEILLNKVYNKIYNLKVFNISELNGILKLILRESLWCNIFSTLSKEISCRFGYDYYVYFTSNLEHNFIKSYLKENVKGNFLIIE